MTDILERIRHAKATASNDDYSEIGSDKRKRHVERLDTFDDAHVEIERLRAALKDIQAQAMSFKPPRYSWFHDRAEQAINQQTQQETK